MRKVFISVITVSLLLSSCETYTGSGAYSGSTLGAILGSAIGGIADGPRGSDIGTIVGMAGGAIIGGAIGNAQDRKRESDLEQYQRDKAERAAARAARKQAQQYDDQAMLIKSRMVYIKAVGSIARTVEMTAFTTSPPRTTPVTIVLRSLMSTCLYNQAWRI